MRRLSVVVALVLASVALGAPDGERDATDRARELLAAGDPGAASRVLADAIGRADGDEARDRLRCLLGAALLADRAPARAEEVLRAVTPDGACGRRAGWTRVEALLALGRADEAAGLAATLAEVPTGPDRDGASAEAVAGLARRLAADPDRGRVQSLRLYGVALGMQIGSARRAALADEAWRAWEGGDLPAPTGLCDPLLAGLGEAEDPTLRARAALVCGSWLVVAGLPPGPPRDRAAASRIGDATTAALGLARAAGPTPDSDTARTLAERWEAVRVTAARDAWAAVSGADAGRRAVSVSAAAGAWSTVADEARAWLDRWPTDPHRAELVALETGALLAAARGAGSPAAALAAYDRLLARHPTAPDAATAGFEAGLVARASGDLPGARRRWETVRAAFPGTSAAGDAVRALGRATAFDGGAPENAAAFLRGAAEDGGQAELDRLRAEDLALSTVGGVGGPPRVHVVARNLERIELRVHRIDPLAWVRAGHDLEDLHALDVAPIAPDRTVPVEVPGFAPWVDRGFDVPVPVPGPGLYAVTAAGPTEEARALLLVSELRAVTRTVGGDTAVAVFDAAGRPVPRAEVHLVDAEGSVDGRTDGDGLFVARGRSGAPAVLVEKGGSWALIPAGGPTSSPSPVDALRTTVELDRRVHLSGDHVGARIVAHAGGRPVTGTWTVWLAGAEGTLPPVAVEASALGTATVDLPLPPGRPLDTGPHPRRDGWVLWGLAPGETQPRHLASVRVAAPDRSAVSVDRAFDDGALVVTVRDPDDLPIAGAPIRVDGALAATDASGALRVPGPRATLPWRPRVEVSGLRALRPVERPSPEPVPLRAALAEDLLRPGERPVLRLEGEGEVRVVALRTLPARPTEPPRDPWVEAVEPGLRGWHRADGDGSRLHDGWWEVALDRTVTAAPEVALEPLPPGDYDLVVIASDQRTTVHAPLRVDPAALRATGMRDVGAADVLRLVPDGGAALLTAEGAAGLLWAGVRGPGRAAEVPVDGRWRGEVVLAATGADGGRHVRAVSADPDPVVAVTAVPDGDDAWTLRATVTDAAGRPLAAEVSFTAWDPRVSAVEGDPAPLDPEGLFPWADRPGRSWGDGGPLLDGDEGSPIAPALLAENELRRERERARDADRTGLLSDNALAEAMLGEVPLEFGSLGASGYGSGGGSGYGHGGIGTVGGDPIVLGRDHPPLPGLRERVVWRVVTAADGVATVVVPDPDAVLEVRATAVTRDGVGRAATVVDTRGEVALHVRAPAPGSPLDRVHPVATVVNHTAAAVTATVSFGAAAVPVALGPGEARRLIGPDAVPAGGALPVTLRGAGPDRTVSFSVPVAEGEPAADGPVTVVAAGPDALAAITTRGPAPSAAEAAALSAAGRAALAAWRVAPSPSLVARIEAARLGLRSQDASAVDRASFLAELAAGGPIAVPAAELAEALDAVRVEGSTTARLRAATALARGGRVIQGVDALRAEAASPEERAWVARLDRALGRGPGPAAPTAPPLPGDEALVDWVLAHARDPRGPATVAGARIDGLVVLPGAPEVAGPAVWWRATGLRGGDEVVVAGRVPRGPLGLASADPPAWQVGGCDPCRVALDDGVHLPAGGASPSAWAVPAASGAVWRARAPGVYHLGGEASSTGRARSLRIEVEGGPPDAPPPEVAMQVGARLRLAGVRSAPPRTDVIPAESLARAALADALLGDADAEIAAAYGRLRAVAPGTQVAATDLVRVAGALRASGDPVGAVAAWRAAVDHALAAEIERLAALEQDVGALAAIQRAREAIGRAPLGAAAGEAAYLLPGRLLAIARDGLPPAAAAAGITATDVRLTAAAWDREFLATFPAHPRAAAAGLRLGRTLLELHAPETAAGWAAGVRRAHADDPLSDALVFLEAAARTEAGQADAAEPLLRTLAEDLFPDGGGPPRASAHADDARLALARLAEARGRYDEAAAAYAAASGPEAATALAVLRAREIGAPALVRVDAGDAAVLPVVTRGVDRVAVRAYRVDLRTLFLRDQGLADIRAVAVDGVSPVWTAERRLDAGPFPESHRVALPLSGPGAWLVQLDADDARATTLVVRSDLALDVRDGGGERRVDVRSGARPVAGAEVRGLLGGRVYPAVTDVRGVAVVPEGAAVLAWRGDEVAFTAPDEGGAAAFGGSGSSAPASPRAGVDRRLEEVLAGDDDAWEGFVGRGRSELVTVP